MQSDKFSSNTKDTFVWNLKKKIYFKFLKILKFTIIQNILLFSIKIIKRVPNVRHSKLRKCQPLDSH